MSLIHVPEVLRERLGPEIAQALVDLLNEAAGRLRNDVLTVTDDRFGRGLAEERALFSQEMARDRERFRQEMAVLREALVREFAAVRKEMASEFAAVRQEMASEFAAVRQEMTVQREAVVREFAAVRQEIADVRVEVATVKSDLTWKLCYFWTAHLIAIAGLLFAGFKLFA